MRARAALAPLVVGTLLLAGCGTATRPTASGPGTAASGTVTVFAAASLSSAFPDLAREVFARQHPGITVTFSYDGSSALVDQLTNGAPADVFASADAATMDKAVGAKVAQNPVTFASNVLVLVTPPGNPAHVTGLDGSLDGKKLVVCAPQVPCGAAAVKLAGRVGYALKPVSEEQKVTDVLAKVTSGEADAGLVYATDAKTAGAKVAVVDVPGADQVVNSYRIAVVAGSSHEAAAQAWIASVQSPDGQAVLARYGFRAPA